MLRQGSKTKTKVSQPDWYTDYMEQYNFNLDEAGIREQAARENVTHFATGIAVVNSENKILVVHRSANDNFLAGEWELPGGGVDDGETIVMGALRELLEETGLHAETVLCRFEGFDYTTPRKPLVRQINFKVIAKPGKVKLDPLEHDAFRWIDSDDIPSLNTNPTMQRCLENALAA